MSAPDLSPAFYDAWAAMAARLGVDPLALARVSFAETGMYQRHPRNAAAGVWPFIEPTLRRLGWSGTAREFTELPPEQQILPWMERYLQPYRSFLRDDAMVYVAMFLPSRLRGAYVSGDDFVLTRRGDGTGFYEANTILDRNADGITTVGDLRQHMDIQDVGDRWQTIDAAMRARGGGWSTPTPVIAASRAPIAAAVALATGAAALWYFYSSPNGIRTRERAERSVDALLRA